MCLLTALHFILENEFSGVYMMVEQDNRCYKTNLEYLPGTLILFKDLELEGVDELR